MDRLLGSTQVRGGNQCQRNGIDAFGHSNIFRRSRLPTPVTASARRDRMQEYHHRRHRRGLEGGAIKQLGADTRASWLEDLGIEC